MAHAKPGDLKDLTSELTEISRLSGLKQKSPGIFYWKSVSFLHFHVAGGTRWADVKKANGEWHRLEIIFEPKKAARLNFLSAVKTLHKKLSQEKS